MTSDREVIGSIHVQRGILLINGAIYLAIFVTHSFHRHFFSSFYQGYLKVAKQDHWLLNLWYVRDVKIYIRISLAHLNGSEKNSQR
jgi:hypothetical protein